MEWSCADNRATPRSNPEMNNQQFRAMIDSIQSFEATNLLASHEQQPATRTNQNASPFGAKIEPQDRQDRK